MTALAFVRSMPSRWPVAASARSTSPVRYVGHCCKSPANRKRKILRVWRDDPDFARFYCARCGAHGYTRDDQATKVDPQEYLRQAGRSRTPRRRRRTETDAPCARDLERGGADRGHPRRSGIWLTAASTSMPCPTTCSTSCAGTRAARGRAAPRPAWSRCGPTPSPPSRRAIHRTALTPTAEKIDRMSLGPIAGCVIRLWEDAAVDARAGHWRRRRNRARRRNQHRASRHAVAARLGMRLPPATCATSPCWPGSRP